MSNIIDLQLYPYDIVLHWFKSKEDLKEIFEKHKIQVLNYEHYLEAKGWCIKFHTNKPSSLILINEADAANIIDFIKIVRHEIQHATVDVFNYIQANVDSLTDEPYIYLNDFIFDKCIKLGKIKYNE